MALALLVFAMPMATFVVPEAANAAGTRVSLGEYRDGKNAWQLEGLDRRGVRIYFGFDGTLKSRSEQRMKRSYLGWTDEKHVVVRYRWVSGSWMVTGMEVITRDACVTTVEWNAAYGEALGMRQVHRRFETTGTLVTLETEPWQRQVRRYQACLDAGAYRVAYTHNGDDYWFTPALGQFTGN